MILMDGTLNQLISLFTLAQTLERNLSTSVILTIIPGVACIGGVFLFHLGIVGAIVLYNLGLAVSILNALRPLIKHQFDASSQSNIYRFPFGGRMNDKGGQNDSSPRKRGAAA